MKFRHFLVAATAFSLPTSAFAADACVSKEEAQKIGVYLAAETVKLGLDICTKNFPNKNDATFVDGTQQNMEKAAPAIEESEKVAKETFDRVFGDKGDSRFELFKDGALNSSRRALAAFGMVECKASIVGWAKIAEMLAEKPFEQEDLSVGELTGELPMCPRT